MTVPYRVFECGLQKRYLSLICHYKGRFLQAIFHTSMPMSIHIMTMMVEVLQRRRRDFLNISLSNRSNVLNDAPHLFTESYFTFSALLKSHEVFALVLLTCCAAGATFSALKSRNHPNYSYLLGDTAVFFFSKISSTYKYRSDIRLASLLLYCNPRATPARFPS